ncbi:MAG: YerC/YecD family TrpR-related protein [Atopobiaceae bacterium]|jgi:TrpR-related protein YerC/YecD
MDADMFKNHEVINLLTALCQLENQDEAQALLEDLCTPREIEDLAQRLEMARLLDEGASYLSVSKYTGASSTTVSRVSKCLNNGAGGYRLVLDRLKNL